MRVQIVAQQDAAPVGDRPLAEQGEQPSDTEQQQSQSAGRAGRPGGGRSEWCGDAGQVARPASSTAEQYDPASVACWAAMGTSRPAPTPPAARR